jgi:hypothetical protein
VTAALAVSLGPVSTARAAFLGRNGVLAVRPVHGDGIVLVGRDGRGERRICMQLSVCGHPRFMSIRPSKKTRSESRVHRPRSASPTTCSEMSAPRLTRPMARGHRQALRRVSCRECPARRQRCASASTAAHLCMRRQTRSAARAHGPRPRFRECRTSTTCPARRRPCVWRPRAEATCSCRPIPRAAERMVGRRGGRN